MYVRYTQGQNEEYLLSRSMYVLIQVSKFHCTNPNWSCWSAVLWFDCTIDDRNMTVYCDFGTTVAATVVLGRVSMVARVDIWEFIFGWGINGLWL